MNDKLDKLCQGVAAIAPGIEIRLKPSETEEGQWSVVVSVGDVILIATDFAPLDEALGRALGKIASISTRMMAAVRNKSDPPDAK